VEAVAVSATPIPGWSRECVHNIWFGMLCSFHETPDIICDRWRKSFDDFYDDMGDLPAPCYGLQRIDREGNYEPDNCFWESF
jgi:hypothetical protein